MNLPEDILDRPADEAAGLIALGILRRAEKAAERLAEGADKTDLHKFRVAVRRLRSTLRAWKKPLRGRATREHRRDLSRVQRATGGGRDLEVAADWIRTRLDTVAAHERPGEAWVARNFAAGHEAAVADVRAGPLSKFHVTAFDLRERLQGPRGERAPRAGRVRFAKALAKAARRHLDRVIEHLARVSSVADVEEAHEARIRVKRLRYLVDPLAKRLPEAAAVAGECKRLQTVLGDLNDASVLADRLAGTRIPAGGEGLRVGPGVDSLRRGVIVRSAALFAELDEDWLQDCAAVLRGAVSKMVLACTPAGERPVEIERKYLLTGLPEAMPPAEERVIDQGWLPGRTFRERLRCLSGGRKPVYRRTVKLGRGVERVELEEKLSPAVFHALWPLTEGCRVHKRRFSVAVGDRTFEIDEFLDREGFVVAEVELGSADEEVEIPAWLAPVLVREVTDEAGFTNLELAR